MLNAPTAEDYLNASKATVDSLLEKALKSPDGYSWENATFVEFSIYGGNTGAVYFLLHVARATGNQSYLEGAVQGARFIINRWNNGQELQEYGGVYNSEWGFYNYATGIAFTLNEVGKLAERQDFQDFAFSIITDTFNAAIETENGPQWSGDVGVIFDSGIVLFLLHASKTFDKPEWHTLAVRAGERILKEGLTVDHGMKWLNANPYTLGLPEGSEIPNLLYGTSGVAYTMGRLYEETGEKQFLDAAVKGADYIRSIAMVKRNSTLIPYSFPDHTDIYYLGLCHDVCSTSFIKLQEIVNTKIL